MGFRPRFRPVKDRHFYKRSMKSNNSDRRAGVSLTELLCVLAILSVLVGMYAWSLMQAFVKIKAFIDGLR